MEIIDKEVLHVYTLMLMLQGNNDMVKGSHILRINKEQNVFINMMKISILQPSAHLPQQSLNKINML